VCDNPPATDGGKSCAGNAYETRACNAAVACFAAVTSCSECSQGCIQNQKPRPCKCVFDSGFYLGSDGKTCYPIITGEDTSSPSTTSGGTTASPTTSGTGSAGGKTNEKTTSGKGEQCEDTKSECGWWSKSGYCSDPKYGSYMEKICCRSCQVVSAASASITSVSSTVNPLECKDKRKECKFWSEQGFCSEDLYGTLMKKDCCASCKNRLSGTSAPSGKREARSANLRSRPNISNNWLNLSTLLEHLYESFNEKK
jgi:hypothetical protein